MAYQSIPQETKDFFDRILTEAGLHNLAPTLKEKMYQDLSSRFNEWIYQDLKKHLKPKKLQDFESLVEKGVSSEELQNFFLKNIPNCQNLIAESMLTFKDTFLRGVKRGKK